MEYRKRNPIIFIISGKAKSGKDMCASLLEEVYKKQKVIKLSYAYYLKEYVKKIGFWDGKEETKPRKILQEFGISFLKKKINKHFLVNRVLEDIKVYSYFYDVIIITDARMKEEIKKPKQLFSNVITIRMKRGKENHLEEIEKNHITETALDAYTDFDYTFVDIEKEKLKEEIEKIKERLDET